MLRGMSNISRLEVQVDGKQRHIDLFFSRMPTSTRRHISSLSRLSYGQRHLYSLLRILLSHACGSPKVEREVRWRGVLHDQLSRFAEFRFRDHRAIAITVDLVRVGRQVHLAI